MTGLAALFAILSSVSFGVSDVLSGAALRRHTTAALALWGQSTGLVLIAVSVAAVRPSVLAAGLVWGVAAGALGALAVLAFYTALQRGSTTVVAPIAGCGVLVPIAAGVLRGEAVGWLAGAGSLAAVAGVLVVARSGADEDPAGVPPGGDTRDTLVDDPDTGPLVVPARGHNVPSLDGCIPGRTATSQRSSVRLAVLSAVGLGLFFLLLDAATTAAGSRESAFGVALVLALAVQVGALSVTMLAATRHTRRCLRLDRQLLGTAVAVGLLDLGADLFLNLAVGYGPLAVVGPLGSLSPVVAVLLATLLLRQRVPRAQGLGIVVVLVGIGLIAVG